MGNFTSFTVTVPAFTVKRLGPERTKSRTGKDLFRFQNIFMAELNHNKVSYFINMQWPR